jgi:ubiquinone/menaquinone biosynthesis C-methylase UbiE
MIPNPIKAHEFMQVTTYSGLSPSDKILDIGCGNAHWTMLLAQKCDYAIGVEPSKQKIETAKRFIRNSSLRKKMDFFAGTLEEANFPENSFDHIFSFCVLEHISNLHEVLVEARRVLKPGGEIHVSVDSLGNIEDPNLLKKHQTEHGVVQYFTLATLETQLAAAGFLPEKIYAILKSEFAKNEFTKRIKGGYKHNPYQRVLAWQKLIEEDKKANSDKGIMIVGHAKKE